MENVTVNETFDKITEEAIRTTGKAHYRGGLDIWFGLSRLEKSQSLRPGFYDLVGLERSLRLPTGEELKALSRLVEPDDEERAEFCEMAWAISLTHKHTRTIRVEALVSTYPEVSGGEDCE